MKPLREIFHRNKIRKTPANSAVPIPLITVRPLRIRRTPKRGKPGWEAKLKPWQFQKLVALLKNGMTLKKAVALAKQWGITTSSAAVSIFFHRYCVPGQPPQLIFDAAKGVIFDITISARLPGLAAPASYTAALRLPGRPKANAQPPGRIGKGRQV